MSNAYSEVVTRAELRNIALTSSSFEISAEYTSDGSGVRRYHHTNAESPHIDDETKLVAGVVKCRVWMLKEQPEDSRERNEESNPEILSIDANYIVMFHIPGTHSKATIEAFFERMAPFSVWPYFRVHVARVGCEAAIHIPILPIKKLVQSVEITKDYVDPDDTPRVD